MFVTLETTVSISNILHLHLFYRKVDLGVAHFSKWTKGCSICLSVLESACTAVEDSDIGVAAGFWGAVLIGVWKVPGRALRACSLYHHKLIPPLQTTSLYDLALDGDVTETLTEYVL